MPGNTIDFELKLKSNLRGETDQAKLLNKELDRATGRSRGTVASAASQNIEYGRGRGTMGATGASARDFANQAQGLGGLVRVYAALAANIYAVSTAFNLLSQAMNTANIVQGLNQLGAQSGQALGALSKRFAETTGNAISLRDAMEATAQASAAGLSPEQFLKLGEVAKKASQALGRDTADSINRLTRGIVKLEPELLDELGIFTKIEKATTDYARSIGKSASQLTDFEKRQAFANAALKEGLDKFGGIKIDTNPYDKLLATLKDTLQVTLELVNVGVKPLVDFLNSNPIALKALLAGLAALIAKQFIPAIRDWRKNIGEGADEAKQAFTARRTAAETALNVAKQRALQQKDIAAEKWVEQVDIAENKLKSIPGAKLTPRAKAIISKADLTDITQKEIDYIEKLGKKNTVLSAQYKELAAALNMAKKAHEDYLRTEQKQQRRIDKPGMFTPLGTAKREEEQARKLMAGRALVSQAYQTAGEAGLGTAIKGLFSGISTQKLGAVRGTLTAISGTAVVAAKGIGMLASGLMSLSGYIGAAIGVYQIFDAALSRNGKQVEAFNSSIEKSEELIDNANRVQKEFGSEISTNAIYARSNSLEALSRSATEVTTNFQKALDSSSIWDTVGDKIKSAFGFGLQADFAENIAKQWSSQLSLIPEGPLRTAIEDKIKQAAGSSTVSIEDLVAGLRRQSRSEVAGKVTEVNKAVAEQSRLQKQESTAAKVVQENFKSIDTAAQNVINTLKITDPIGQFGEELLKLGMNMGKAFQFAQGGLATLKEALKDTQTLRFVDPKALEQLRSIETSLPKISQQLAFWNEKAAEAQKLVNEKNTPILKRIAEVEAQTNITQAQKDTITGGLRQTLDTRTKEVETATRMQQAYQKAFNDLRQQLSLITKSISTAGAEYINQARTAAQEQARISFSRFILKGAEGIEGFAKRQLELTLRELDQQERQITVAERLNNTMIQNSIINERGNALLEQGRLEEKQKKPGEKLSPEEEARLADVKEAGRNLGILLNRIQSGKFNLEELKSDTPIVQGFITQLQLASVQSAAARAAVEGKRTEARVEEKTGTLQETQRAANLRSQYQSDLLQKQQQLNGLIETGLEYLTASELSERQRLQTLVLEDQQKRAIKQIDDEIELTSKRMLESSGEDLRVLFNKSNELGTQRVRLKELQALDEQILGIQQEQLKISNQLSESLAKRQQKYTLQTLDLKGTEQETNAALELLQLQNQINPMRADDFARREKSIKLQQIENENTRGLADLEKQRDDVRLKAQADIDKLLAANSQADISAILEKLRVDEIVYQKEAEYLKRSIDLKKQSLNLTYSLSERQKAYDQIFTNSFENLGDVLIEWAKTGKWAGKELFNSLIADLARYELKLQMLEVYKTGVRPSLLNFLGFGGQTTAATEGASGGIFNQDYSMLSQGPYAKGGMFNYGIEKFAKGGMFTNSIVNQPTLFKFARGTGLMGEAGPEAIMPLKRDSQGNLGVRSNGQKTEVVINNYSNQPATAEETTDSRGNRKIEVVIGEMTAGEFQRSGSTSQRAMRSTFGLAPQLIRR